MLTVTEKKLADSRKRAKILADNRKSHHRNDTLFPSTLKNDNSCGGRASELASDKFICAYLGKVNHIYL